MIVNKIAGYTVRRTFLQDKAERSAYEYKQIYTKVHAGSRRM